MDFPSLQAPRFLAVLQRAPLNYRVVAQEGSHRTLESESGYPKIGFSWHDRVTISGSKVRRELMTKVGLSEQEAFDAVHGKLKKREVAEKGGDHETSAP